MRDTVCDIVYIRDKWEGGFWATSNVLSYSEFSDAFIRDFHKVELNLHNASHNFYSNIQAEKPPVLI
jgi:hypothetical protein